MILVEAGMGERTVSKCQKCFPKSEPLPDCPIRKKEMGLSPLGKSHLVGVQWHKNLASQD